jgi:two-component system, OmpR family, KDP operon response regulator KdpE
VSIARATILLIDDDQATAREVHAVLAGEGYRVDQMPPGLPAIRHMLKAEPDLVILGINGPDGEWQFCRQLLTFLDRPLFLLLASADEVQRAKGLDLGADDCMVKPVLTIEFVARVRALLRRWSGEVPPLQRSLFVDGDLKVDLTRREVRLNNEPVALTKRQFKVLSCLIRHLEETVPSETLLREVWGQDRTVGDDVLKQYIYRLRQKLEPDPHQHQRIVATRGEGYRLERLAAAE